MSRALVAVFGVAGCLSPCPPTSFEPVTNGIYVLSDAEPGDPFAAAPDSVELAVQRETVTVTYEDEEGRVVEVTWDVIGGSED